jgi:hypothetical protein
LLQPALACRLDPPEHNAYQPWGKGAVYMQAGEENVIALPELNFNACVACRTWRLIMRILKGGKKNHR